MEAWKAVIGYEGWYEVSNQGRVKRIMARYRNRKGGILVNFVNRGYSKVGLCRNKHEKCFSVHRLVLMAFIGLPQEKQECNHKNGIKTDNRPENLEWVTKSENKFHSYRVLGAQTLKGELHGQAKLTDMKVMEIKQFLLEGVKTQKQLADIYKIDPSTISRIKSNKRWGHV